ncbi:MAG TPA: hypothetical protein EYH10_05320 [Deltaproteobacteria bacterium]|nr:hypothetical protein [Deltaproteobacteria bacterium]
MNFPTSLKIFCIIGLAAILLVPSLQAKPSTSFKSSLTREKNLQEGSKNSLIMPYAFSSKSMGFTLGIGGRTKGYGQEQMLLGVTAFGSFDETVALFPGMWDYRPSFANAFSLVPREWRDTPLTLFRKKGSSLDKCLIRKFL